MAEHDDTDLRTGAKAAAAAAAVGAAVGVARAIAARAEEAAHRDDEDDADELEPEREERPVDEQQRPASVEDEAEPDDEDEPVQGTSVDRLRKLTRTARELLQELNGADVDSVSAVDRTRDGWRVTLETVEVRRVPDSMDVMATYDVELDGDGDLVRYERRRRYARAQSDHGDGR
jgi:Gas vesicle synthesis protein GvpO